MDGKQQSAVLLYLFEVGQGIHIIHKAGPGCCDKREDSYVDEVGNVEDKVERQ